MMMLMCLNSVVLLLSPYLSLVRSAFTTPDVGRAGVIAAFLKIDDKSEESEIEQGHRTD